MLKLYAVPGKAKSEMICKAFAAGAPKNAEGSVFFGTEGLQEEFREARTNGAPWFYCDNSYFDKHRGTYFRVTKNALQVDPKGQTSDGSRFDKLGVPVRGTRSRNPRPPLHAIVTVPQSDQFMKSIGALGWNLKTIETLLGWSALNSIGFSLKTHPWQRDKAARNATFAELLPSIDLVVTHSSAAAITAILEGIPAISTSLTAAAHEIGGPFTAENVWGPKLASRDERIAFAEVLADNQFTMEEFRSGEAWSWLERK